MMIKNTVFETDLYPENIAPRMMLQRMTVLSKRRRNTLPLEAGAGVGGVTVASLTLLRICAGAVRIPQALRKTAPCGSRARALGLPRIRYRKSARAENC